MTNPGKGGRGKAAPYQTVHYRIPEPIKPTVERLAAAYRILVVDGSLSGAHEQLLKKVDDTITGATESSSYSELEELHSKLAVAQEQIDQLRAERERVLNTLAPAMEGIKANAAGKLIKVVKQAFPELA